MVSYSLPIATSCELPYEKFVALGADKLTDAELLAIIIRTGSAKDSALDLGKKVLELAKPYGGLLGLNQLSLNELTSIAGIGEVKAVKIKCLAEISLRIHRLKKADRLSFSDPDSVAAYYMEDMRHLEYEQLMAVFLDNKNRCIAQKYVAQGSAGMICITARDIFVPAFKHGAVNIFLLHNHPSGDPNPSHEDFEFTRSVLDVAKLTGIRLIDHIIIGDCVYYSFKKEGIF